MSQPASVPAAPDLPSGALLFQIFEGTPAAVYVKDAQGRYLLTNRRFRELFCAPDATGIGQTDAELFPAPVAALIQANDREALRHGTARNFEEILPLADGSARVYLALRFPIPGPVSGESVLCGVATDITRRKRREDAMRNVAVAVSTAHGQNVFEHLVRSLAAALRVEAAFIALPPEGGSDRLRMLALCANGEFVENLEYVVAGTPCETVVGQEFRIYPSGVRERFARAAEFAFVPAESYAGYPLSDSRGGPLGLISVISRKPMRDPGLVESVLRIYAARAVTEIERRRSDEALRASAQQYRAIFNASLDALVLRDEQFRIVDVNPAFEAMTGRPREYFLGRSEIISRPGDADGYAAAVERLKAGEPILVETTGARPDGTRFEIEVRGVPMRYQGRPHLLFVARDISERKRAEMALRASEEQYRAIFNAAADALVLRDADFRIVEINDTYMAMTERTRDEVIGADRVIANPGAVDLRFRALHRAVLAGESGAIETQLLRKDGTHFEVEVRAVPIRYRGTPHVLYMGRDITARKRAEEALRASEEHYRAIFNATADALVLWDSRLRRVDVNPAYERMLGYTRAEVLGEEFERIYTPDYAERRLELVRRTLAGERCHVELQSLRKGGEPFQMEVRTIPVRYRGEPHVLAILRDITERRRAEQERAALEAQLRQAQKMEAIGQLAGGIAHDFNNILTGIMGYLSLAAENPLARRDAKLGRHLGQAHVAAQRARDLIAQLLAFSRGRKGTPQALDVAALTEESLRLLGPSLPSSIELESHIARDLPRVRIDPVQLEQIVLNLCINARDAMGGSGRLRVEVSARPATGQCASCRCDVSGRFVELAVSDDGPGITPDVRERMFEPFFSTKEVGRGSGMGLASVHGIVHEHGGHIVVETAPGAGATFRVCFPPLADHGDARRRPRAAPGRVAEDRPALSGHVLVIDDEHLVAEFLAELLSGWGLRVTVKHNPVDAEAWLGRSSQMPDLVLTDQTMPKMTGLEFAKRLAARAPQVPVILCSGYADSVPREEIRRSGVRALLHKPIESERLLSAVRAALAARKARPPRARAQRKESSRAGRSGAAPVASRKRKSR